MPRTCASRPVAVQSKEKRAAVSASVMAIVRTNLHRVRSEL